jgi:hypothetical protein
MSVTNKRVAGSFHQEDSSEQRAAVLLTVNSLPVEMKNNKISGHADGEVVKETFK